MYKKVSLLLTLIIALFGTINLVAQKKAVPFKPKPVSFKKCVKPPSGMVAWFPFDENSGTSTSNLVNDGNDGILVNNPNWVSGQMAANSLNFNANTYVKVNDQPKLNFGKGDFSIDAWIRMKRGSRGVRKIVSKRINRRGNVRGYLFYVYQNNKLGLQLADGMHTNTSSGVIPNLTDGRWHQVAVTVDRNSSKGIRYYFDGRLVGTANPTSRSGDLSNSSSLSIGSEFGSSNFIGGIDELELFNRVLSRGEIIHLFRAQRAGKCKVPKGCPLSAQRYNISRNASTKTKRTKQMMEFLDGVKQQLPGQSIRGYGEGGQNKFFGDSFPLKGCKVCAAKLTAVVDNEQGLAHNDALNVYFSESTFQLSNGSTSGDRLLGVGSYGTNSIQPGRTYLWKTSSDVGPKTLELNLNNDGNISAGASPQTGISRVNQYLFSDSDPHLEVWVQDDTIVKSIDLEVWTY